MRVFSAVCKDEETGYTMVMEDCSYNEALEWLQTHARRVNRDVFRVDNTDTWHYTIYTGKSTNGYDINGNPDKFYGNIVKYFYDEKRGYLLSE